jgi:hypothetical protein
MERFLLRKRAIVLFSELLLLELDWPEGLECLGLKNVQKYRYNFEMGHSQN